MDRRLAEHGWGTIIFLATLAGVDQELHEAARVDGATIWQRVWHIDIPGILPTVIILLILQSGQMLNVGFEKIFLMQNPLNIRASEVWRLRVRHRTRLRDAQFLIRRRHQPVPQRDRIPFCSRREPDLAASVGNQPVVAQRPGDPAAADTVAAAVLARSNRIRNSREDSLFFAINYTLLTFAFIVVAYPLIYILSSSFSDAREVLAGRVWLLPIKPNLDGYQAVFEYEDVWLGYGNTIFYTVFGTIYNVAMTLVVAYPLARRDFVGRNPIMFLFTFTMFFHGGLIPTYLLIKSLGMIDTRAVMIIPWAIGVWNVIITRTYLMSTIPGELYEAARVDGASNTRMFWHIVLPLSGPIIAVITLFYAVNHWNTYFNALIYLRDRNLRPLQLVLREILIENSPRILDEMMADMTADQLEQMTRREFLVALLQYSLIVVATVPVMAMYPFVQKHFIKGVMIGGIKG